MRSQQEIEALLAEYRGRYERAQTDVEEAIWQERRGDIGLARMRLTMFDERIRTLEWVLGKKEYDLENEAQETRLAHMESQLPRESGAVLPDYEMHLLLFVIRRAAEYFNGRVCDDLEFAELVPKLADRQAIMKRFHEWNGDPEVWAEDLVTGNGFAECRYWTYGTALAYFAHRLEDDSERRRRTLGD